MKWAARASLSLLAASSLLFGGSASAAEFGISAGYFAPWSGTKDGGWLINMQLLSAIPESNWRWGAEVEYRQYDSTILGVNNIGTQDALLNGVVHWRLWPDQITPYVGLGAGIGLTFIDRNKVRRNTNLFNNFHLNSVGFMMGALALVGAEFPIGRHLAIYTELRGNIWARFENGDETTFRDTSGWDARGGVKLRF